MREIPSIMIHFGETDSQQKLNNSCTYLFSDQHATVIEERIDGGLQE